MTISLSLGPTVNIADVDITTVCSPSNATGYRCRCEDQFVWSYSSCVQYGACDVITNYACGCIRGLPPDGQYCQPPTVRHTTPVTTPTTTETPATSTTTITTTTPTTAVATEKTTVTTTTPTTIVTTEETVTTTTPTTGVTTLETTPAPTAVVTTQETTVITTTPSTAVTTEETTVTTMTPSTAVTTEKTTVTTTKPITTVTTTTPTSAAITMEITVTATTPTTIVTATTPITVVTTLGTTVTSTTPTTVKTTTPTTGVTTLETTVTTKTPTTVKITRRTYTVTTAPTTVTTTTPTTGVPTEETTVITTIPTTGVKTLQTTVKAKTPTTTVKTTRPTSTVKTTRPTSTVTTTSTTVKTTTQSTAVTAKKTTVIATPSTTVTTKKTQPASVPPPPRPTNEEVRSIEMEFSLNEDFDERLNDATFEKSIRYKKDIQNAMNANYVDMPGYLSVTVTRFRSGSVIVTLELLTTNVDTPIMGTINAKVLTDLRTQSYKVEGSSIKGAVKETKKFQRENRVTLPGSDMVLICRPNGKVQDPDPKWRINGVFIKNNEKYSISGPKLTVRGVTRSDNGFYEFVLEDDVLVYSLGERIVIPALPRIKLNFFTKSVECEVEPEVEFQCCVQDIYKIKWKEDSTDLDPATVIIEGNCITYKYQVLQRDCNTIKTLTCEVTNTVDIHSARAELTLSEKEPDCDDDTYGKGQVGEEARAGCKPKQEGFRRAVCNEDRTWRQLEDRCVLTEILNLEDESQDLAVAGIPVFLEKISNSSVNLQDQIAESPETISTIVNILGTVANLSAETEINQAVMTNFLETVSVIVSEEFQDSWSEINGDEQQNTSSVLLGSLEAISGALSNESFSITTPAIQLNKTTFSDTFSADLNSTTQIEILETAETDATDISNSITTILFSSLHTILPTRNSSSVNDSVNSINGNVVLVKVNSPVSNVSFTFDVLNDTLANPQCVFWNFSLFDGQGGWDDEGCELQSDVNGTVTCNCNHLTSFSILMSPYIPEDLRIILDFITYIGVGISMGCLVVCLIIEACVWKSMTRNSTSYMRHVSIVNIAVSLLIADIWFIIGASISSRDPLPLDPCRAATFFIHFFYLSLFFWMLFLGMLLLYVVTVDFPQMSKQALAIAYTVGYGSPLIIAVVTVAVTTKQKAYIRNSDGVCWLNFDESKALLAFVIPALIIVVINIIVLIVVLFKTRASGLSAQPDDKSALKVIARCLAVLTPFFGLTWALGVGTMTDPSNKAIHGFFAFFNSLQGFFILVFGTLLEKKVRQAIGGRFPISGLSLSTKSTKTAGTSSSGLDSSSGLIRNRHVISVPPSSLGSESSDSFSNA